MEARLSVGDVLGTTAKVLAGSFPGFFVTAALFSAPSVAIVAWLADWRVHEHLSSQAESWRYYASDEDYLRISVLALLASGLASAFCIAATQAGVLYGVVEQLAGRTPGVGAVVAKPIARMPAAVGAMVLVSSGVLFGSTCLGVPALVLAGLFYFAIPAAVIEDLSPFKAVARSVDLTKGNRALILTLVGVLVAIFAGVRLALRVLWGAPPSLAFEAADMPDHGPGWSYFVALALVGIAEAMVLAVASSVMYARLRERDGLDLEALADVFA